MERVLRYASIGLASLGIGLGVAAADSAEIGTTGPDSTNKIEIDKESRADVDNNNSVDVNNNNTQNASSGNARVTRNTTGGDAESGAAENDNSTETEVRINNSGSGNWSALFNHDSVDATIDTTGTDSYNKIEVDYTSKLYLNNNNSVGVNNNNAQNASSGNAKVYRNTSGGSATSGDATNTNNTSTSVHITN